MAQVAQVYDESRSFHLAGVRESASVRLQADEGEGDQTQRGIEMWFQRPRLRLDGWNWLTVFGMLGIEDETGPQVVVLDGDHEYRLSSGQWTRRKIWEGSPTLRLTVGLPPARVRYLTKDEAELSGRPVWVVRGKRAGIATTWWIEKSNLTVAKFEKEQTLTAPGTRVRLQLRNSVVFHRVEPNAAVPDGVFEIPPDVPLEARDEGRAFFSSYFKALYEKARRV